MMKKMMNWVFVATLVCSSSVLTSCKQKQVQQAPENNAEVQVADSAKKVVSTELIRTDKSWDGVELPDYLQGRPELVAVKYVFPAGQKLGWDHHPVMNYGVLVQGELTIIGQDGKEKVVHEGEAVVEMVNTIHHGENRGNKPVILYMFYLSQKGQQLAVQHPEIPLE
jgi:quercetin dioxygenase-like cupin family protein